MPEYLVDVDPTEFAEIQAGRKRFGLMPETARFEPGDVLRLREYSPTMERATGLTCAVLVTSVLREDPAAGLRPGYVAVSLQLVGVEDVDALAACRQELAVQTARAGNADREVTRLADQLAAVRVGVLAVADDLAAGMRVLPDQVRRLVET